MTLLEQYAEATPKKQDKGIERELFVKVTFLTSVYDTLDLLQSCIGMSSAQPEISSIVPVSSVRRVFVYASCS